VVRQTPDGERSTIAEGLMVPSGLTATDDDLWVTDWGSGSVWRVVTHGEASMTGVTAGLANPEGLVVEADGSLLVMEAAIGRLSRILPTGETETVAEGLPTGAAAHPATPPGWAFSGVAVCPSGTIYVTSDRDSAVWRVSQP
jgi:sugar lactone lactonase YvrE